MPDDHGNPTPTELRRLLDGVIDYRETFRMTVHEAPDGARSLDHLAAGDALWNVINQSANLAVALHVVLDRLDGVEGKPVERW